MKMNRILEWGLISIAVSLVIAGCQPEQSIKSQEQIEPAPQIEAAQQSVDQQPDEIEIKDDQNAPKIVVTKDVHDFGEVGPGSSQVAHYEFTNKGAKTLFVKNIQSTCGCSKPTLIKDGKRYTVPLKEPVGFEPGQKGQVEVTFKAQVTKGKVSKNLYIVSDDPKTPRAQFTVKAQIVVNIEVTPENVDLRFDQENAGMPDLVVKSTDGKEFSIQSANTNSKVITLSFDPTEKATQFILKPKVDLEKLNQFNSGVIQISTTHPRAGKLLVRYTAKPLFEVSNARYILQNIEPGTPIIRDNLIRSNYGEPVEIESFSSRNGYMDIAGQEPGENHLKLSIKITPPSQESSSRRYITDELTVTLKGGHKLSIRCSGWFRLKK